MISKLKLLILSALCLIISNSSVAQIKLPSVIDSNMVLQRNSEVSIWGWAKPGKTIKVTPDWDISSSGKITTANSKGEWMVELETPKEPGPYKITIKGDGQIELENILIGEVWICSGQSNMERPLSIINNSERILAEAQNYPEIRIFNVSEHISLPEPANNCPGKWSTANSDNIKYFSAIGYLFARKLCKKLNVPIGIIGTNWGGTPAQAWISKEKLKSDPYFSPILEYEKNYQENFEKLLEKYKNDLKEWQTESQRLKAQGKPLPLKPEEPQRYHRNMPAGIYNGMLNPIMPYSIRGVIWYQGESDVHQAYLYHKIFPELINSWREGFGQENLPFYFVQIAPYKYDNPNETKAAELREAQLMTLSMDNTGMVVTMDIGNENDIHPKNKIDVANRLALWALKKQYGFDEIVHSGPIYKNMEIQGSKIRINFEQTAEGLTLKGDKLRHFEIAGKNKKFLPANAIIQSDSVLVWNENIKNPVAVRYAFKNSPKPEANLYNSASLPASPFRTDNWPTQSFNN